MENKYKLFLEHDWSNDSKWQNYISKDVYPTPPGNKILTYKKKYYKRNIDSEFDVNYNPETTETPKSSSNTNTTKTPTFIPLESNSFLSKSVAFVEFVFWIISLFFIFTYHKHAIKIALIPLVIRIARRMGKPNLTYEFALFFISDEHFQVLLYVALTMIDRFNIFLTLPYLITVVLNVTDYLNKHSILVSLVKPIVNKRVMLSELRANCDIFIGFLMVIGVFVGTNSFLLPIFFWQFIRFKYIFNNDCIYAFRRLNNYVNKYKVKMPTPIRFVIDKIQQLCEFLTRTQPEDGKAAGGSNCIIF